MWGAGTGRGVCQGAGGYGSNPGALGGGESWVAAAWTRGKGRSASASNRCLPTGLLGCFLELEVVGQQGTGVGRGRRAKWHGKAMQKTVQMDRILGPKRLPKACPKDYPGLLRFSGQTYCLTACAFNDLRQPVEPILGSKPGVARTCCQWSSAKPGLRSNQAAEG
jgi:hypothetical protein